MFITGLGTAVPPRRYLQTECWETVQRMPVWSRLQPRARAILRKVLGGRNGIEVRHLALEKLEAAFELTPDAMHARFREHGPKLAAQAACAALLDAGEVPSAIDALVISTCTGYLCPGLTSYVSERLGLRPDLLALDLVGQGCGAAVPNLRTGEALLAAGRCQRVLSICVEVCSAAFFFDDDPGVLISACLFGDGAGAAVLSRAAGRGRRIEWRRAGSDLHPENRDLLRFEQRQGMLRNILSPEVPALAAQSVERLCRRVLAEAKVEASSVRAWLLHPGGRDVLKAIRGELGLSDAALRWSAAVLNRYGNLSSASLFFVLREALAHEAPAGPWWLASFGAGFSSHGALLEVN